MDDDFWDEILDLLANLRALLGEDRHITEDMDVIFDREKRRIYVSMPLRHIKEVKDVAVEHGNLYILAKNGEVFYREIKLELPIKALVSYSFKNGVLDIILEY